MKGFYVYRILGEMGYGYDEFSKRLAPYNITVEPFPQVTAA